MRCTVRLKTHGVENRRWFSESKIGTDLRNVCHANTTPIFDTRKSAQFSTPIRTCSISRSIFGSTWSIETVVTDWYTLFSFRVLESIRFSSFLLWFATIWMHNCGSNSTVVFFGHVCFRSRKSAPVYNPVCLQPGRWFAVTIWALGMTKASAWGRRTIGHFFPSIANNSR